MEAGKEEEALALKVQLEILNYVTSGVVSWLLKCVVDLRIADIIHAHGGPMTLSEIAAKIPDAPSPRIPCLERVMRLLVHKNIFAAHHPSDGAGETLYGLTDMSKWILQDSKPNLVKCLELFNHPEFMRLWQCISQFLRGGDPCTIQAYGCTIWEFAAGKPELDQLLTDCMGSTVDTYTKASIDAYKEDGGLNDIGTLVDVGGRTGRDIYEIVKAYPHIKGINFDLPRVISLAHTYEGVTNVAGDMFDSIPSGDALFFKTTLADFPDDIIVKILKISRKAIPEKNGKVIIMDIVAEEGKNQIFEESQMVADISMLVYAAGRGKTEMEWKKVFNEAGFPRYKVIKIPALPFIIEAYPT